VVWFRYLNDSYLAQIDESVILGNRIGHAIIAVWYVHRPGVGIVSDDVVVIAPGTARLAELAIVWR